MNFSAAAWRNIILNICMFVPFGILLPSCIKSCRSWWKTYLAGFVFTVGIESVQLVARRGLFELDDIMGNTVGAMIGYGIFALGIYAWQMWKKKEKISFVWKKVMLLQLPLLITVLCFGCIFGVYQMQELGNLSGQCLIPYDAEKISIQKNVVLQQETTEAPVYQCNILSKEETVALANQVLSALGASVDETQNDFYDETAVLKAAERFSIWVEYEGGTYYPTTDELEIQVVGCELEYQIDSYAFEVLINQMEQSIKIAAIEN